ncbi:sulfotransferase [Pseudomonadota bacterium]
MELRRILSNKFECVARSLVSHLPYSGQKELDAVERDLFEQYRLSPDETPLVFILASPRTGSTMLYQMMAKYLLLHYFSNYVVEHFSHHPFIGTVLERGLKDKIDTRAIPLSSEYGTTRGKYSPNEASEIFENWFDWGHPSEIKSARITNGRRDHMLNTLSGISCFSEKPIVIKNAWNCFRVQELVSLFPASHFIWLKRDIVNSSYSTLLARKTQGDPGKVWNSASPFNYDEIRRRPYIEQVVEQHYWTNHAIESALKEYVPEEKSMTIWYEDIVSTPEESLAKISENIGVGYQRDLDFSDVGKKTSPPRRNNEGSDFDGIKLYASEHYPNLMR